MTQKMTAAEVQSALVEVEGWALVEGRDAITRKFKFSDFRTAWSFMEDIAVEADEMSHHPEWTNIYNRVEIILTTHDVNGLSDMDFDLAYFINEVAKTFE